MLCSLVHKRDLACRRCALVWEYFQEPSCLLWMAAQTLMTKQCRRFRKPGHNRRRNTAPRSHNTHRWSSMDRRVIRCPVEGR